MFLHDLYVKDFKGVREFHQEFGRINVISGPNRAGKTSITEAIQYFFTGALKTSIQDYIRRGSKRFELKGKFTADRDYLLEIKGDKSATKKLSAEGMEALLNSDVNTFMSARINPVLTRYSSIASQEKTTQIITDSPTERLDRLKTILGMDTLAKSVDRLVTQIKSGKDILMGLQKDIQNLESQNYDTQEVPAAPDIVKLRNIAEDHAKQILEVELHVEGLKSRLNQITREEALYESSLQDYKRYHTRLAELAAKQAGLEEERDVISAPVEVSDPGESDELLESKNVIDREIADLQKELVRAKEGKCPRCGSPYTNLEAPEDYVKAIEEKQRGAEVIAASIKKHKEELKKYQEYRVALSSYEAKKKSLETQITQLRAERERLVPVIEPEVINTREERDQITKDIETAYSGLDLKAHEHIKKEIVIAEQLLKEIARIEEFNTKQEEKRVKNQEALLAKRAEHDAVSSIVKIREETKTLLDRDFSSFLLEKGLVQIESRLNEFFSVMNPDYQVFLKRDKKNLEFTYTDSTGVISPVEMLSGMESQMMALGFRVALTSIQDFGIFVLDEADSWGDDTNSKLMFDNFLQLPFEQVFIVSHHMDTVEHLVNEHGAIHVEM